MVELCRTVCQTVHDRRLEGAQEKRGCIDMLNSLCGHRLLGDSTHVLHFGLYYKL